MNYPSAVDGSSTLQLRTDTESRVAPKVVTTNRLLSSERVSPLHLFCHDRARITNCKCAGLLCRLQTFANCRYGADIIILYAHYETSGSLVKRGLDRVWMERAPFSVSPMFCSACACLACHPFPPRFSLYSLPSSLSSTTTSVPSPTPSHISAIPNHSAWRWRQGNRSTVCVCVWEELYLSTTGTTWRPMRGLDSTRQENCN